MNNQIVVHDNLLPKMSQNKIFEDFMSNRFPWFFLKDADGIYNPWKADVQIKYTHMFASDFCLDGYPKNPYYTAICSHLIDIVCERHDITWSKIHRAKANVLFSDKDSHVCNIPHKDSDNEGAKTLLYYVNDSDGDTCFFEKTEDRLLLATKIPPKQGTAVLFDSTMFHAARNPINTEVRFVINIVFS